MKIREITNNKKQFLALLLLADEQENMIDRYLEKGTMYVLEDDGVKAECVVTEKEHGVLEIKNIAVAPENQRRGYGKALVDFLIQKYAGQYAVLQAGTGDSPLTIPFYERCGFTRSHRIPNFFIENYDHPIYECGVQLVDMIYLQRALQEFPTDILEQLLAMQDNAYQTFQAKLMPTVLPEAIIGVRTPLLRKLAKELSGTPQAEAFLNCLPHKYYEENNLHAFLIEQIRDYDRALAETERFLPYIDNWATCDCFCPKVFAKHKEALIIPIRRWLDSDRLYTARYAMGMLMRYYLDDAFRPEYLAWVADVHSDEYYLNMMRAWYFATALAKQPEAALPWLTERRLDPWTHNKTIQKAVESYRIPSERKQQLRGLRIHS